MNRFPRLAEALLALSARRRRQRARMTDGTWHEQAGESAKGIVRLCGAHSVRGPLQRRARSHLHLGFRALSKSLVSCASNARCVGSFDASGEDAMKRCKIEIALKARPRLSLLVAAAVTLSGAFFSARAQEPIKIGFGVSLTGGLASSGKAHLMSKQIWAEEINAKGGLLGRPIKLVYYDDQTNAATVPGIYAKLIDVDKVDLLMGHATNLIVAAMPLIIQRNRMVMVLLALTSNAEFKYPRYFQNAPFGSDTKLLSRNFFEVARGIRPAPQT